MTEWTFDLDGRTLSSAIEARMTWCCAVGVFVGYVLGAAVCGLMRAVFREGDR